MLAGDNIQNFGSGPDLEQTGLGKVQKLPVTTVCMPLDMCLCLCLCHKTLEKGQLQSFPLIAQD